MTRYYDTELTPTTQKSYQKPNNTPAWSEPDAEGNRTPILDEEGKQVIVQGSRYPETDPLVSSWFNSTNVFTQNEVEIDVLDELGEPTGLTELVLEVDADGLPVGTWQDHTRSFDVNGFPVLTPIIPPTQAELDAIEAQRVTDEANQLTKTVKMEALENLTVTTSLGNTFDGNETARNNMLSAIQASGFLGATTTTWKLADNSKVVVSLNEVQEALALAIQAVGVIVTEA